MTKAICDTAMKAFERFDIDRIFATPFETNVASHRVLEKAWFVIEGLFKKIVIKNGEMLDELYYANCINKSTWVRKEEEIRELWSNIENSYPVWI